MTPTTTTATSNTRSRAVSIHYDRGDDIPSSVRSSAASSPDPEYHHSQPQPQLLFPPIRVTSFHNDDDLLKGKGVGVGGGFAARIGRARFLVMMIMVLPLSLGAWVISNHRLYDVSFVFAQDGRVKVKRRTQLFRPLSQRSKSTMPEQDPELPLQQQQQQQQQQPILFVPTTPVPTVSHQNLNPVVSKVKLVAGKHGSGATIRKTTQWSTTTTTTMKKVPPRTVAATGPAVTRTMKRQDQQNDPERNTPANDEGSGFFRTIRLKHRSRPVNTVPIPTTTKKKTPPQPTTAPKPAPSSPDAGAVGFFRRIRLRRRSADEKRQSTTKTSSVVPSVMAVTTPVETTNGVWAGLRNKKEHRSDPAVPVFQIRLGTTKTPSSPTNLGLTLRRPAIRKQRAEEARLRLLQEEEDQRMALQSEQERLREAKLVQKQSFRDMVKQEVAKRMEARRDAAAVRSMMEAEAKFAAAQAKEEARNAKLLLQAHQAQAKIKASTTKKVMVPDCSQILHAAKAVETTGFWRRIRLRQRRGIEKTCQMAAAPSTQAAASSTKKISQPQQEILVPTKDWWGPIRFRRRPKEPSVAPADTTIPQSVAAKSQKVNKAPKKETKKISQPQQEISVEPKDWWGHIRFRRRPNEPSVAPADTTTSQSVAKSRKIKAPKKEKSAVKPETPTNVVRQVVEAEAKTKDTSSTNEAAPLKKSKSSGGIVIKRRERKSSPAAERHSWLGGVTRIFGSKKVSNSEVANPLVEKNAPENVLPELLRHFTGAPTDVQQQQQQPMVSARARTIGRTIQVPPPEPMAPEPKYVTFRIRSKPPKAKRPPAIRIRRVRRE